MKGLVGKSVSLKIEEEVVKMVRAYPLVLWPRISLCLVLIAVPFFFLFPLFRLGYWGVAIFSLIVFSGLVYGLREFIIWYFNVCIITNQRVIDVDQRGFFDQTVSEIPYEKIKDVSYRIKGVWQTMFSYGNLNIQAEGAAMEIELRNIRKPGVAHKIIVDWMQAVDTEIINGIEESGFYSGPGSREFIAIKNSMGSLSEKQLEEVYKIARVKLRQIKLKTFEQIKPE